MDKQFVAVTSIRVSGRCLSCSTILVIGVLNWLHKVIARMQLCVGRFVVSVSRNRGQINDQIVKHITSINFGSVANEQVDSCHICVSHSIADTLC